MQKTKFNLIIGSLLHDIGKIHYRNNDGRNHSQSGYDYIKNNFPDINKEILDCIIYHHFSLIKNAKIANNSPCYFTYFSDNVAAFIDRRENGEKKAFDRSVPFQSVFNILNGNNQNKCLQPMVIENDTDINYPTDKEITFNESFYSKVIGNITNSLNNFELTLNFANSLISILEGNLSYIPSSSQLGEYRDISLFDHLKITTAIACCYYDYFNEKGISNYELLLNKTKEYYNENAILLYSLDISGIQDFIYTISSKGALKGLRARSFYLDMVLENSVDYLLEKLELTRANVLYLGGGHAYLLLSNTKDCKDALIDFEDKINSYFLKNHKNKLYLASGYCECSPNNLRDEPHDSYRKIFQKVSNMISLKKSNRYTAEQIKFLNNAKLGEHSRECQICKSTENLNNDNICSTCADLLDFSSEILSKENIFFTILNDKGNAKKSIELPFNQYLTTKNEDELRETIKNDQSYIRSYSKNNMFIGKNLSSKLWIGDYSAEKTFKDLAEKSQGIERLGVLRADVDDLGKAFVSGFDDKNISISRTSTFSRMLSMFFKYHINGILKNDISKKYDFDTNKARNATVVYSGGDDVFVVGGWYDIICFAIDLHKSFEIFSQGALSISAGIGIFDKNYPISAMARQTGKLEELSKNNIGKNSITLFDENNIYHWNEFIEKVMGEKFKALREYFSKNAEHGKTLLYKILELIRQTEDEGRLNIARLAYLLARLKPNKNDTKTQQEYSDFSSKMYDWIQNKNDSKQLTTAIYIYIYSIREK